MKPMRDKSKYASYSKSTSQSSRSSASAKERDERASHGSAGKSPERAGVKPYERGGHGGGDEHVTHSPIDIQKALKDAPYSAKKQALVKTAQTNGAVDNTLKTLCDMPDDKYDTPAAVSKVVSNEKRCTREQEDDS